MKNLLWIFISVFMTSYSAYAECVITSTYYSSCKPGYYLLANDCVRCPLVGTHESGTAVYGITVDRNTGGITSCYAPAGPYKNSQGVFQFNGICYYK